MDIACGVGKGSNLIASLGKAGHVTAYDLDENAIRYAKHRNARENIQFAVQNALKLEAEKEYDVVVSFETIEHIPDVDLFLRKIAASLKEDGLFIVSTPISHKSLDDKPDNPFHVQEWGFKSFHEKLGAFLNIQDVYLQLYDPIPVQRPVSLFRRVVNKVFNTNRPGPHTNKPNTSKIEKYTEQYPIEEIGTTRKGYQLVVCKKKG
jgi:SAM-dependent methyltransferase